MMSLPDAKAFESAVHVVDPDGKEDGLRFCLHSDVLKQSAICYLDEADEPEGVQGPD